MISGLSLSTPSLARRHRPSPKNRWRAYLGWSLLAVLVCLSTLLTCLPATWVAEAIARQSHSRVWLADANGTLWQGEATLVLQAGPESQAATALPGRLQWKLAFWPLLSATCELQLRHTAAFPSPLHIHAQSNEILIGAGQMQLPASLLEGLGMPFNTIRPSGQLSLQWSPLRFSQHANQWQAAGQLEARIAQLASRLSPIRPLGSYLLRLEATGHAMQTRLQFRTLEGPLTLKGQGELSLQGSYFEGEASADPAVEPQLLGLLSMLGRRQGEVHLLRF